MHKDSRSSRRFARRRFLQAAGAGLLYAAAARPLSASSIYLPTVRSGSVLDILPATAQASAAASYRVGVGANSNGYAATLRALDASAELSAASMAGRTVLIKPNLVAGRSADSGITTDPEVVRALVDRALAAGAAEVKIIEGFGNLNNFAACGYSFFDSYDPSGRVSLVDLAALPVRLVDVPQGGAYRQIYFPELLLDANTYYISAAKMKCHGETFASLSLKNAFGLTPERQYRLPLPGAVGRFAMHQRGTNQTVLDLNLIRTPDFAVVDGIWAMEGMGPMDGSPVRMDTVVAGSNALAVDRVCLALMSIDPARVQHIGYAANRGLGPRSLLEVSPYGDRVAAKRFAQPTIPPVISYPSATPLTFAPTQGQSTSIGFILDRLAPTKIDIVQVAETSTTVTPIRLVQDWSMRAKGLHVVTWDGRDDNGAIVPPGVYKIMVEATNSQAVIPSFATGWIGVTA